MGASFAAGTMPWLFNGVVNLPSDIETGASNLFYNATGRQSPEQVQALVNEEYNSLVAAGASASDAQKYSVTDVNAALANSNALPSSPVLPNIESALGTSFDSLGTAGKWIVVGLIAFAAIKVAGIV